jgi:uncharacterized protein YbjT (DUF2867 family)
MRVAVAGATGFIGSRLTPALAAAGHDVLALARHPEKYDGPGDAAAADIGDEESMKIALSKEPVDVLVYLVHSLEHSDFESRDADGAKATAAAAAAAGVGRIIYLGGLGNDDDDLSDHLRSRHEVEDLLGSTGIPVTVLRAGIVIGNGGASFEMMRELVSHLPVMITPKWVGTRCQPIALDDVVAYIVGLLGQPTSAGQSYDIGGPEVLRYMDMLHRTAKVLNRPLLVLPVPVLTPGLSARWLSFITSVDTETARNLVYSMTNEVVAKENAIRQLLPRELMPFDDSVRLALQERDAERAAG